MITGAAAADGGSGSGSAWAAETLVRYPEPNIDVVDDGTKTANRREFCSAEPDGSDGLRVDTDGNLWCAWSGGEAKDGVAVYAPDGTMIGRIMLPERCANVCFGGKSG